MRVLVLTASEMEEKMDSDIIVGIAKDRSKGWSQDIIHSRGRELRSSSVQARLDYKILGNDGSRVFK
jgi:hypothetical protein